ncbi:mitotic checkpoint regulator, MAD2B-interacting-domain-containing protein [Pholiota molesta]|nr:mitotic checkpoint regulator, MAD2B-interacting-domain-containing protein [Pholiota molesta]
MLGIEDYGSDDESSRRGSPEPVQQSTSQLPKALPKAIKSQRAPKKITIALPSLSAPSKDDQDREPENDRPMKKQRTGAGVSSLLSMLPTPKESNPTPPPTQRVLGGGSGRGLNFQTKSQTQSVESTKLQPTIDDTSHGGDTPVQVEDSEPSPVPSTLFRPTSLAKGKKNISIEETNVNQVRPTQSVTTIQSIATSTPAPAPASDFFSFSSLGSSSKSSSKSSDNNDFLTAPSTSLLGTFSAAPELPTFEPPEPTREDPYPGYYQLPSGTWAAYDTEYYGKFMKKWEAEYNAHGFEGLQSADVEEVDALKEMEKAKREIQEREEKKAVTQGAGGGPVAPKMNISASKMSGVARSRHQLSTLLKEAYENREALEERIAQGKRNRKEAGNKYDLYRGVIQPLPVDCQFPIDKKWIRRAIFKPGKLQIRIMKIDRL